MTEGRWRDVALVAPHTDMGMVAAEVEAVSTALRAAALTSPVLSVERVREVLTRQTWDLVWFACHGTALGVQIGPGVEGLFDTDSLIQAIRKSGARLVVLNTCDSKAVGAYLCLEAGVSVICWVGVVNDVRAYRTGAVLAQYLAQGMTVRRAYEEALPGSTAAGLAFWLYEADAAPRGDDEQEEAGVPEFAGLNEQQMIRRVAERQSSMVDKLNALDTRTSVIEHDLKQLMQVMDEVHEKVNQVPPGYWVLWAVVLLLLVGWIGTWVWMIQVH